ncbi:Leucine-rich repeat LGI family member [Trichinella spiralis]|uniref:Leucine-rich repeat LGI family member n=1 Tax=Trichinella spiralis TaxID=6334 RepID=A0ABR3K5A2_TRISP
MIALLSNTHGWDKSEKASKKLESTLFRVVQYCSMAQCRSETVNRKQCYSNNGNYDPSSNCAAQENEWKECVAFCYDEKLINLEEASTSSVDYKIDLLDLILKKFSSLAICDETQCRSEAINSQDNAFISCPSKYATEVLPQLRSLPWLNTFEIEDSETELKLPWKKFARLSSLKILDLRAAKLDCSCQNMWLAFWEKILEPITPIESLSIEMDVLLWFLADVNRVCDLDCPKTVRDIYELPNQINLPKDAFNHCLTEGDPATESAIYENFKTRCGFGSLQLNVKQVIFGYNKTDDVVVCKATNKEPAKPDTFTWCMGDDTAVLSVNNVRPNSSGWIICFGNGYLPQAAAIPLLVITPPVYLRFEMDRVNQQELFIRFQLHSYPNVDLHLFIWETDLKNWRELSLTEEYTSTNGRRGALWFSRTLRSLASTTTEVGCISKVFEIKPDENNVLCAANADSPTYQTPKSVKFNILRIHAVPTKHDDANYLNYADGQTDQSMQYSPTS